MIKRNCHIWPATVDSGRIYPPHDPSFAREGDNLALVVHPRLAAEVDIAQRDSSEVGWHNRTTVDVVCDARERPARQFEVMRFWEKGARKSERNAVGSVRDVRWAAHDAGSIDAE
ncbi:hypothetical protein B0H19DRAFT_1137964 [Mycena capillaripes]|nr:hypothetical protein B0H19DRAFT_1137964 [Mycena capillaripes]